MHDEAGFLSAIRSSPADDTARLVFADWLDEQDDPLCQAKAEFIRLELRMTEAPEDSPNRTESLLTLRSLAAQTPPSWLATVGHAKLEGCQEPADVTCPGRWERLASTSFDDLRRCGECKKVARFCSTLAYAIPWAQSGHCVAISSAVERRTGDLPVRLRLTPEMIERLRNASACGAYPFPAPLPSLPPVPQWEPTANEGRYRIRRRPKRKKGRSEHRNVQRENWEDVE